MKFWLLVAVVLATTLQPILHNHSLIPDATDQHYSSSASLYCPLCAIGADRDTDRLNYTVSWQDLTGPLAGIRIYGPATPSQSYDLDAWVAASPLVEVLFE